MKTILVPTDFSETSEHALDFAVQLAKKDNSDVLVMHGIEVVRFYEDYYSGAKAMTNYFEELQEVSQSKLDKLTNDRQGDGVTIRTAIKAGNLLYTVEEIMEEEDIDLIVMGTKGASGFSEVFIGSNTEKMVRQASCPVISVPASATTEEVKRIIVPLDLSEIRKTFLDHVSHLQKVFDAELNFLWVQTPHDIENTEQVKEELTTLLIASGIAQSSFKISIVKSIFPSDGILLASETYDANLIAMATHGRRGISHWLHGSLTEDTVNHAERPVWTFKMNKDEKPVSIKSTRPAGKKPEYRNI